MSGPSVLQCPHFFFVGKQVDKRNHLYISIFPVGYISRHSALREALKFSIDPLLGKTHMGSVVHSRECGEATAVSVTSSMQTSSPQLENALPGA